jgi:hypothetical protein
MAEIPRFMSLITMWEGQPFSILYGGPEELHEASIVSTAKPTIIEGKGVTTKSIDGNVVLQWKTSASRSIVKIGDLSVYILGKDSVLHMDCVS